MSLRPTRLARPSAAFEQKAVRSAQPLMVWPMVTASTTAPASSSAQAVSPACTKAKEPLQLLHSPFLISIANSEAEKIVNEHSE